MTREQIEAIRNGCEGVTPGRWIAAAKPSSVVGWPVVSEAGRSIASMNYVHWSEHNPAVSGDRTFNRESKANAEHIARLDPGTVSELCRLALVGLDVEAKAPLRAKLNLAKRGVELLEFERDAYRRGAEDMRERAAKWHEAEAARLNQAILDPDFDGNRRAYADASDDHVNFAAMIRALPIEGEGK